MSERCLHRTKASRVGLLLAVAWLLTTVGAAAQTGRVFGRIFDAETNQPVRGATVLGDNANAIPPYFTAVTDAKGFYSVLGIRPGVWGLTVTAPGYYQSTRMVRIQLVTTPLSFDFKLVKVQEYVSPLADVDTVATQKDILAARTLLDDKRYDQAIAAYRALLEKFPSLSTAHLPLGSAYRGMKDYERALDEYRKISETDPWFPLARVQMGLTELESGDLDAAERLLTSMTGTEDAIPEALDALGDVKLARRQPSEADAWYKKASEADPSWTRPYLNRARAAIEMGDPTTARMYLEKVIGMAASSPDGVQAKALLDRLSP